VIGILSSTYTQSPAQDNIERILLVNTVHRFPGMLGSLDCMHWSWKNCPLAWSGQITRKGKKLTIVLEAVATYDLWIWHGFFGMPSSHNDVYVLDSSQLFVDLLYSQAPSVTFTVTGSKYNKDHYLADG
jgi:hypothetical protein